jgi:hypothetical protein
MTTAFDIERRLRLPAPDEPAVLPPLVLPIETHPSRMAPSVRWRVPATSPQGARLVFAVVALVVLMLAVIAAGALRLLENRFDPTVQACQGSVEVPAADSACVRLDVPDGWRELAAGPLFPGDFTEEGIAYETVYQVLSSVDLGGCPNPGGPPPTAFPIASNAYEFPRATPDPGLLCLRSAALPENAIRVETMKGSRTLGLFGEDGPAIPDTSEPTRDAGWTEEVGGRPTRLTVTAGDGTPGTAAETRTWDVLLPGEIDRLLRIRAEIAGPNVEAGRATVKRLVDSVTFLASSPELREADAAEVLRTTLDSLDRQARQAHSDFYGCFPRQAGTADGTISGGPGGPIAGRVDVSCTSSISPSLAGVWRIVLDVSWPAGDGYPGDTLREELFKTGVSEGFSGGYFTSLAGRPMPVEGVEAWLPDSGYELPPPLIGPLNLPPGSVVQMLWPGQATAPEPDPNDDSLYPSIVGTHLYVIDGPRIVDGDEWYQVQTESGLFPGIEWARGTRDGRPQLAVIEPTCPSGEATVGELAWLIGAERLLCMGNRDITFDVAILINDEQVIPVFCGGFEGTPEPCETGAGSPPWLTGFTGWWLYGPGGPSGSEPGILAWFQPSVGVPPAGQPLRVRGHFDDPEATGCSWPSSEMSGLPNQPPDVMELVCRERFVISGFEPATE